MSDLYLKGDDQAAIDAALLAAGLIDEEGRCCLAGVTIDRIGQDPQRVIASDLELGPTLETYPGYHANIYTVAALTAGQIAALAPVTIAAPANPMRVRFT